MGGESVLENICFHYFLINQHIIIWRFCTLLLKKKQNKKARQYIENIYHVKNIRLYNELNILLDQITWFDNGNSNFKPDIFIVHNFRGI